MGDKYPVILKDNYKMVAYRVLNPKYSPHLLIAPHYGPSGMMALVEEQAWLNS